jgi:uncharacterized protein (DUF433 family)
MTPEWTTRIEVNPKILVGKPVVKGTRLAVEFVLGLLAEGWTHEELLEEYPQLKEEDISAVLHYAAHVLGHEKVYVLP